MSLQYEFPHIDEPAVDVRSKSELKQSGKYTIIMGGGAGSSREVQTKNRTIITSTCVLDDKIAFAVGVLLAART